MKSTTKKSITKNIEKIDLDKLWLLSDGTHVEENTAKTITDTSYMMTMNAGLEFYIKNNNGEKPSDSYVEKMLSSDEFTKGVTSRIRAFVDILDAGLRGDLKSMLNKQL